jgi:hypothetical protein
MKRRSQFLRQPSSTNRSIPKVIRSFEGRCGALWPAKSLGKSISVLATLLAIKSSSFVAVNA